MTGGTRGVTEVIREGHVSCSESRKRSGRCRAAGSCAGKAVGRELLVRPAPAPPAAPQRQQARRRYPPRRNLALHRGSSKAKWWAACSPPLGRAVPAGASASQRSWMNPPGQWQGQGQGQGQAAPARHPWPRRSGRTHRWQ